MNSKRSIAAGQLLLIFPAILFMGSLVVRQLSRLEQEPAYTAHRIVMWYAGKAWTLWVLLITLPLVVLVTGWLTLLRGWGDVSRLPHPMRKRLNGLSADRAMLFVAVLTLTAGFVLAIVAVHMAAT